MPERAIGEAGEWLKKPTRRVLLKPRADRRAKVMRTETIKAVFARDHYRCRCCGYDRNLHPHELLYRSAGGDPNDETNVVTLCNLCHLEGEHGQNGKGKTLTIVGRNAAKTLKFTGPWIAYIRKYRSTAGRREGGLR